MIPRIIHRIWLGGDEPEWTLPFKMGWTKTGWAVYQWDDELVEQLARLVNQDIFDNAESIVGPELAGQLRSDVLRYELLYQFGGVYVDTDMELLKPSAFVEAINDGGAQSIAAWEVNHKWIGNTFMAAAPHHDFLAELIHGLEESVASRMGERPARVSGPQYVTRTWRALGGGLDSIWPQRLVYPYSWSQVHEHAPGDSFPAEALMVHHWANKRRELEVPT